MPAYPTPVPTPYYRGQSVPGMWNPISQSINGGRTPQSSQTNPNAANYRGSQRNRFSGAVLGTTDSYSGGSGGSAPNTQSIVPGIDPLLAEIDNAFNARMSRLNSMSDFLRGGFSGYEQEADTQFNASKGQLDASKSQSERDISSAGIDATNRKDAGNAQVRRQFNDLQRSGVQRFGGASTAGQAFSEISTVEAQRGFGDVRQTHEAAQQKIADFKMGLEERYSAGMLQLKAIRDNAINEARRYLDQQLLSIESAKGEAEEAKSNKRLAVLQDYRQNIFDVNASVAQWKMNLDQEYQAGQSEIEEANSVFSTLGQGSRQAATGVNSNPSLSVNMSPVQSAQQAQPQLVGQIQRPRNVLDDAYQSYNGMFG